MVQRETQRHSSLLWDTYNLDSLTRLEGHRLYDLLLDSVTQSHKFLQRNEASNLGGLS